MNTVQYKPFKRRLDSWQLDTANIKENDNGRRLFPIKLGVQNIVNSDTGEIQSTIPCVEYIYEDILRNIFANTQEYHTRVALGCKPQLIVTYENRLVVHNDEVYVEIEKIQSVLKDYKLEDIADEVVNSLLNYNTQEFMSDKYRKLIEKINELCDEYYPPDFVGLVIREYFLEQTRNMTEYDEDLHLMSQKELKKEIAKNISEKNNGKLAAIKTELLYSYLMGDMIINPQRGNT